MTLDRRSFLARAGAGLATGTLVSDVLARPVSAAPTAPPLVAPGASPDWDAVRAEFDLEPGMVQMSGFFLAPHPRAVRDAVARHRRGLDANPYVYVEENVAERENAVRAGASRYAGADPDEFAMTDSTTMGIGLVYGGMKLAPGDEIVTDTHDHIVTTLSTTYLSQRTGATLRQVPMYDDPATVDADRIVETAARSLRPSTRLLALTWVHSGTGVKMPVRRIADAVAAHNAGRAPGERVVFAVDGVHGFGIEDVDLRDLGCDSFMAGCHKWIFGPRGTGLIWARPESFAALTPTIATFDPMWRSMPPQEMPPAAWLTPGGFHSFENRWALADAFRFQLGLGREAVSKRVHALNRRCKEQMARLPRVTVKTPLDDDLSGGIICFEVDGLTPQEVVRRLHERGIVASVTPRFYVPAYARVAPGLLTGEDDVDATVRAVAAL